MGVWPCLSARKGTRFFCPLVFTLWRTGSLRNPARLEYCWLPDSANLTKQLTSYQLLGHPVNWVILKGGSGSGCFQGMQYMCHLKCGSSQFWAWAELSWSLGFALGWIPEPMIWNPVLKAPFVCCAAGTIVVKVISLGSHPWVYGDSLKPRKGVPSDFSV